MYFEALDLKIIQIVLLQMLKDRPKTSPEIAVLFETNYHEDISNSSQSKLIARKKFDNVLRYMAKGKKRLIKQDPSKRWMITSKGEEALSQEKLLSFFHTFRDIVRKRAEITRKSDFINQLSEKIRKHYKDYKSIYIKNPFGVFIASLKFPTFPNPARIPFLEQFEKGTFYWIDYCQFNLKEETQRLKELKDYQKHLTAFKPDVDVVIGQFCAEKNEKIKYFCFEDGRGLNYTIDHFRDNSVPLVNAQFLFRLASDVEAALEEIYRVLHPSGFFTLVEYAHEASLFQFYIDDLISEVHDLPEGFLRVFNPEPPLKLGHIEKILHKSSFEIIHTDHIPNIPTFTLIKPG